MRPKFSGFSEHWKFHIDTKSGKKNAAKVLWFFRKFDLNWSR